MTDNSAPSHRLSNAERDGAVASLARALADGRITTEEFTERSSKAKAAVTQADLAPLFADLPADQHAAPPAASYAAPPAAPYAQPAPYAQAPYGQQGPYSQYGPQPGESTAFGVLRAIVPIIGLILFFTFGYFNILGGWSTSWIWFVLVGVFFALTAALAGQRRR